MVRLVTLFAEVLIIGVLAATGIAGYQSLGSGTHRIQKHHESGQLYLDYGIDSQGRLHGSLIEFYPDGTVSKEAEYSHGSWVWSRLYYENGRPMQFMETGLSGDQVKAWSEDGDEI